MLQINEGIGTKTSVTIDQLTDQLTQFKYSKEHIELVKKAYIFAEKFHRGQTRKSGEPYITHPVGVASILTELRLDISTIITGLLHDTVEDTPATLEDINKNFGKTIEELVDGVTKISQMRFRHTHEKQGENIRKMIVAMGRDVRVILVKIADRLYNMRTLSAMKREKQEQIAKETLDIYAPLASRLGISSIKTELEDLGFRYSAHKAYYQLAQKVNQKKEDREQYIKDVKERLSKKLSSRVNFIFEIQGRPKNLYSIHKKMSTRNVDYEQVYDVLAFRVCVENLSQCYEILGLIHSFWRPIPGRFKDFIAMAKANNYQSLHTTVIGPQAQQIEVQIRTFEMHKVAEWGIAAHWQYKEDSPDPHSKLQGQSLSQFNWLRELVNLHQQTNNSDELLENIKTDLAESEIYVFTPKGEVKEFPKGATPIDFAYSVHTDVGNQIVAARVNGKMVPLKYNLQNGDSIEIITSKNQSPSRDWIKYCVTSRAKSRIRSLIKTEQRDRALVLGKEILEKGLHRYGFSLSRALNLPNYKEYLKNNGLNSEKDLFISVGYGKLTPLQILTELVPNKTPVDKIDVQKTFLEKVIQTAQKKDKNKSLIDVSGISDMMIRFGKCCNPIPGDSVIGFITRGRGITVHRANCNKAFELDQARSIDVNWNHTNSNDRSRKVSLKVISNDVPGLLKKMSETFSLLDVDIVNAQIRTTRDKKAISIFDAMLKNTTHLAKVINSLESIEGVMSATRISN